MAGFWLSGTQIAPFPDPAAGLGWTDASGWMSDLPGGMSKAGVAQNRGPDAPAQWPESGSAPGSPGSRDAVAGLDDQGGGIFGCLAGYFWQDR
jgi:hypothetical protein